MNLVSFLPSEELPDALGPVPAPDSAPATLVTVGPHHVPQHQRVAVHLPAPLVQRQGLTLTATLRTLLGKIVFPTKNETFNCFRGCFLRGCSQMTSAFFGVSDTPWCLCQPIISFWPTPWCFKLMTTKSLDDH